MTITNVDKKQSGMLNETIGIRTDKDEFVSLVESNKKIIFKICNSYCQNHEDRKDLVQEIIIQLWNSRSKFDNNYKLSTWIYRIALNVAISFYRKDHKRQKNTSRFTDQIVDVVNDDGQEELEANIKLLHQFIGQLSELNKALIILYLDNNSYKEISEILGITETNVATKISRIKKILKQQFINH